MLEQKIALLKIPGDFKGTVCKKIEWGIIYWPKKKSEILDIFFLFVNMENILTAKKVLQISISRLIIEQHETKILDPLFLP